MSPPAPTEAGDEVAAAFVHGEPPSGAAWNRFLRSFHDRRPALTEEFFAAQRAVDGTDGYDWILDRAALAPGDRVLDLGCGAGALGLRAARSVRPGGWVLGVDTSPGQLARAAKRLGDGERVGAGMWLARGCATALPLASGTVDGVLASMFLMVVSRPERVISEIARVLRPGGRLVATTEGSCYRWRDQARLLKALSVLRRWVSEPLRPPYPHPDMLAVRGVQRLLAREGLEVTCVEEKRFPLRLRDATEARALWDATYYSALLPADAFAALRAASERWVKAGPVELHQPVRCIVAERKAER